MDPGDCPGFSPRRNSRLVQIRSCGQYAASSPRLPANVRHMVVIYDAAAEVWVGNRVRAAPVTAPAPPPPRRPMGLIVIGFRPRAEPIQPHMRRSLAPISTGARVGAVSPPGAGRALGQVRLAKWRKVAAGMKRVRAA